MSRLCGGFGYLKHYKSEGRDAIRDYNFAKENARRRANGEETRKSCSQRLKETWIRLKNCCCPCGKKEQINEPNFWQKLFLPGNFFHEVFTKLIVFVLILSVGLLFFGTISFKLSSSPAELGVYVGIGTSAVYLLVLVSPTFRIIVLLALPELLTKRGRAILLLLCIVWTLKGPGLNIQRNQVQLGNTLTCIQEKIQNETRAVKNYAKDAMSSVITPFNEAVVKVKKIMVDIKEGLHTVFDALLKMKGIIRDTHMFMQKTVEFCDSTSFKPYAMCRNTVDKFQHVCKDRATSINRKYNTAIKTPILSAIFSLDIATLGVKFGKFMNGWPALNIINCDLTNIKRVCDAGKFMAKFCEFPARIKNWLESHVLNRIDEVVNKAMRKTKEAFYFDVDLRRSLTATTVATSSLEILYNEVKELLKGYKDMLEVLAVILDVLLLLLIFISFIKAFRYHRKYVRKDYYDNYYVTNELQVIDDQRGDDNKDTILPLLRTEKRDFVKATSIRMTRNERSRMLKQMLVTLLSAGFVYLYIGLDELFYKFCYTVYEFFNEDITVDMSDYVTVKAEGEGKMVDVYDSLIEALIPRTEALNETATWRDCVKEPSPPDYYRNEIMGYFLLGSLVLCVLEVYMLRTRHCICAGRYPKRERIRGLFLYSQILKSRGGFYGFLKQGLTGEGFGEGLIAQNAMFAKILPILGKDRQRCARCVRSGPKSDTENFRPCENQDCPAVYCIECYGRTTTCLKCDVKLIQAEGCAIIEEKDSSDEEDFDEEWKSIHAKDKPASQ